MQNTQRPFDGQYKRPLWLLALHFNALTTLINIMSIIRATKSHWSHWKALSKVPFNKLMKAPRSALPSSVATVSVMQMLTTKTQDLISMTSLILYSGRQRSLLAIPTLSANDTEYISISKSPRGLPREASDCISAGSCNRVMFHLVNFKLYITAFKWQLYERQGK